MCYTIYKITGKKMVNSMNFVNLYLETEYTMLTSPIRLKELINLAKEYQYEALAITDLNNMHGVLKFYDLCLKNGIKPIIGLNVTLDSKDNFYNSLLLYAKVYYSKRCNRWDKRVITNFFKGHFYHTSEK
jgi:DNA polymerase III alpha subunit (gram-positive type)